MFTAILVKKNNCSFMSTRQSITEEEKNEVVTTWAKDTYYKGTCNIIILKDGVVVEQVAL